MNGVFVLGIPSSIPNEPIIVPKRRRPIKELKSFIKDMEETRRDLRMCKPIERLFIYEITFDCLIKISRECPISWVIANENYISTMFISVRYKMLRGDFKLKPEKFLTQLVCFQEWLNWRLILRDDDFSYNKAAEIIQKKIRAIVEKDHEIKVFHETYLQRR